MNEALENRRQTGKTAYFSGIAAETCVERHLTAHGRTICARRWRGSRGEIDLIAKADEGFIFIEVKKSRSHDRAAARISRGQTQRIFASALEFVATQPQGQLTDLRFDVALVAETGEVEILENALHAD